MHNQLIALLNGGEVLERRIGNERRNRVAIMAVDRRKTYDRRRLKPYQNTLGYDDILNAFTPAIEIADPEHFVGRREEFKSCIKGLITKGSFLVVYGQRGVGKSSLANQLSALAKGDKILPDKLKLSDYLPRKKLNHKVLKYVVDRSVKDIETLAKRILLGEGGKENSLLGLTQKGAWEITSLTESTELNGGAGIPKVISVGGKDGTVSQYHHYGPTDYVNKFRQCLCDAEKNLNTHYDGLLIVIDEFDLIEDKSGFGSIVKACTNSFVKFAIVAVGSSINEIVKDHTSVTRKKELIHVDRMNQVDLEKILKNAERIIDNEIVFCTEVVEQILDHSDGFPYFTQIMGQSVMANAFERGSRLATQVDLDKFFKDLLSYKLNTLFDDLYENVVDSKDIRKQIITTASQLLGETFTTEKLHAIDSRHKEATIRKEMNTLTKSASGYEPILVRIRLDEYRFIDPLFKTYCRLCKKS